ncbi:MAG: DUF262 domain-containing protein [Candidatus Binatus sp.]|uniref:DUF262 domain-containing protein n=1 Tax=Candidatus Binatus sp. TaxID=2811406 RepID=UPI003C7640FF
MPYQAPITVRTALDRIWKHDYVLPAIQREFVWKPEQIYRLFDSLMQDFPIGSFLFWKIEPGTSKSFEFFDFSREYHQRDNPHCPRLGKVPDGTVTAVLDGQQRLTALNIGLRGSLAVKEPNKWRNNPKAFPVKRLYLNLLHEAKPGEEGEIYHFEFLTDEKSAEPQVGAFWFPVHRIFGMVGPSEPMEYLAERKLGNTTVAVRTLHRLQQAVHNAHVLNFYEEESQDIENVLNIFIRANSAGTPLSYSDILLSIATAQWEGDARSAINTLVDALNDTGMGFNFSKDFVLKAGLMLSDIKSVGFKVENFDRENMKKLEANWPKVAETLQLTVRLTANFGLSRDTISADSALLPIAYYLHKRHVGDTYLASKAEAEDRMTIKHWLIRSLIKPGIWGSALDVLLSALREVIRSDDSRQFPVEAIERDMRGRGKSLAFTDEEIQDLADRRYGSRDLFGLLTLLFPFIDTRNQFHIDHIFPRAIFHANKLKALGLSTDESAHLQELRECLPNLQLLQGPDNQSKSSQMPEQWIAATYKKDDARKDYISRHMLEGVMTDLSGFQKFYEARRKRLLEKIVSVLNRPTEIAEPVTRQ